MTTSTDPPNEEAPESDGGRDAGDPALAATSEVMAAGAQVPLSERGGSDPLDEARAEAARMKEQWIRTAADYDNFRKRSRRDLEDARRGGREEFLKELLPVFDNLERAMQSAQRAPDVKAVTDGLTMIQKQFNDTVGRLGITRVPTIGHAFDPSVHEAIQQVETSEHPPGIIVAEVQPGYVQGDRLVRAAMVVVAKPKSDEPTN